MATQDLTSLLSQVLVAFTIEADNEFEARLPHRTTESAGTSGPWLTSMVMWVNGLRHIEPGGTTEQVLLDRAGTRTNLEGLRRWGYLRVDRSGRGRAGRRLYLTGAGRRAQEAWPAVLARVEERWRARFGIATVEALVDNLALPADAGRDQLPDGLPIVGYGLWTRANVRPGHMGDRAPGRSPLPFLLSRSLVAYALDYEAGAPVSLAVGANLLRVLEDGVPLADLPGRTGLSKETVTVGLGWLVRKGLADLGSGRGRRASLTPRGAAAKAEHSSRLAQVERDRHSPEGPTELRELLSDVLSRRGPGGPLLADGLVPPPSGWRARPPYQRQTAATLANPAAALPHFPVVTHRGGWPDGS